MFYMQRSLRLFFFNKCVFEYKQLYVNIEHVVWEIRESLLKKNPSYAHTDFVVLGR